MNIVTIFFLYKWIVSVEVKFVLLLCVAGAAPFNHLNYLYLLNCLSMTLEYLSVENRKIQKCFCTCSYCSTKQSQHKIMHFTHEWSFEFLSEWVCVEALCHDILKSSIYVRIHTRIHTHTTNYSNWGNFNYYS